MIRTWSFDTKTEFAHGTVASNCVHASIFDAFVLELIDNSSSLRFVLTTSFCCSGGICCFFPCFSSD